jgi:uncharacterized membrane protein YjfL (UPF0719 family)
MSHREFVGSWPTLTRLVFALCMALLLCVGLRFPETVGALERYTPLSLGGLDTSAYQRLVGKLDANVSMNSSTATGKALTFVLWGAAGAVFYALAYSGFVYHARRSYDKRVNNYVNHEKAVGRGTVRVWWVVSSLGGFVAFIFLAVLYTNVVPDAYAALLSEPNIVNALLLGVYLLHVVLTVIAMSIAHGIANKTY